MTPTRNFGLLTDLEALGRYVEMALTLDKWVGFDVETGYHGPSRKGGSLAIDWDQQFVTGFSLSHRADFARYVPLRHDVGGNVSDPDEAWRIMKPLLTRGKLVIHHAKFEDRNVRKAGGYALASDGGDVVDTMLDAYVLSEYGLYRREVKDEGTPEETVKMHPPTRCAFSLKDLVKILFDHDQPHIESLFPGWTATQREGLRFNILELTPQVVNYCCEDAAWVLALKDAYSDRAQTERPTMRQIEHEISAIMSDVEELGICVDFDGVREAAAHGTTFLPGMQRSVLEGFAALLQQRKNQKLDSGLSLSSTKQMQALLYRDLGFRTTRMTKGAAKKGDVEPWQKMSTDAIAMEGLSQKHPEIMQLLKLREAENLMNRLEMWLNEEVTAGPTKRAHPNYNQVKVGSGRFAADNPPIQQCPKEERWAANRHIAPWGDKPEEREAWAATVAQGTNGVDYWNVFFRDYIMAGPGNYYLTFDYSQIELRVLAGETQEPALLRAFENGDDVHTLTAAMMLGKAAEDVDKDTERPIGKTMNFALLYGMGYAQLSERLGITLDRAKQLYASYFSAFSRITSWQDATRERGLRNGYCETRFGRKQMVWELRSTNPIIRSKGERVLTNVPIQGGGADIMKMAMIRASRELKARGWWRNSCTIVMNHHDSLTFEVSNELDPAVVRDVLEAQVAFPIPGYPKIVADWELGQRWGSSTAWKAGMTPKWDGERWVLVKGDGPPPVAAAAPTPPAERHLVAVPTTTTRTSGQRVVICTDRMPTRARVLSLLRLTAGLPGDREVWLQCPEGEVQIGTSSLSSEETGRVSMILGGATVVEPRSIVSA